MRRSRAGPAKVALPKLTIHSDDSRAHRPVLVGSLGPGKMSFGIDPEREAHQS